MAEPNQTNRIDLQCLFQITNAAFFPLHFCDHRFLLLIGGGGSGKSYFVPQKIIQRMMREPGHHVAGFRKVMKTCKTSIFAQFIHTLSALRVNKYWRINQSDFTARYLPNGNIFRCLGMDDPEKIKSIVDESGRNLTMAWMEEATEFSEQDFTQINLRVRGATEFPKQIILSLNPISRLHWIKRRFVDNESERKRTFVHQSTYQDNRFIDPEYAAELEALAFVDPELHRIYAKGEWGDLKGLIYAPWPMSDPPEHPDETIYGLDFGFNHPMALIRIDLKDRNAYLTEIVYQTKMTTDDLITKMKEAKISESDMIYCDAAEPDRIEVLYRAGFNAFPASKGQNSVKAGIDLIKRLNIFNHPSNTNITNEANQYKWAEDKNGEAMDVPVKWADDAMDAIRYALFTHLVSTGEAISLGQL